jgi:hypothetical protein
MVAPKPFLALLLASLSATACYEATALRVSVQSPPTTLDCARTADRVFFGAAYERRSDISGPSLFYSPRISATANVGLGWGIAVWLKGSGSGLPVAGGRCEFELETLAREPGCGVQCPYSPQRGAEFDQTLKDMAGRLSLAFDGASPPH